MAMSWYSNFEIYAKKHGITNFGIWKDIREVLKKSVMEKENLFPINAVKNVLITLNGKNIFTVKETKDGEKEKYLFALDSSDITAENGIVRLVSGYRSKAFRTRDDDGEEKSFLFMIEFINKLRVDSFIRDIGLDVKDDILMGTLSRYNIEHYRVNSNPLLCTLDIVTGDYILATEHLDDFVNAVKSNSRIDLKEYTKLMLEMNKVSSISDSMEYFLARSARRRMYDTRYTLYSTLRTGLTDIVPICAEFPSVGEKRLSSGITLVNNLDNVVFNAITQESKPKLFCDTKGEFDSDSAKIEFRESLDMFRESAKKKVFEAPGIGSNDEVIKVCCASKKDIYELTKIRFKTYSFSIMNFILSCLFKEEIGSIIPYSLNRMSDTIFNTRLKDVVKLADREIA